MSAESISVTSNHKAGCFLLKCLFDQSISDNEIEEEVLVNKNDGHTEKKDVKNDQISLQENNNDNQTETVETADDPNQIVNECLYARLTEVRDHPGRQRRRVAAIPGDRTIAEDPVLEDVCMQTKTEPESAGDMLTRKKKKIMVRELMAPDRKNYKRSAIMRAVLDSQSPTPAINPNTHKEFTLKQWQRKLDIRNLTGYEPIKSPYIQGENPSGLYARKIADRRLETFRKTAIKNAFLPTGFSPDSIIDKVNQNSFLDLCLASRRVETKNFFYDDEKKNSNLLDDSQNSVSDSDYTDPESWNFIKHHQLPSLMVRFEQDFFHEEENQEESEYNCIYRGFDQSTHSVSAKLTDVKINPNYQDSLFVRQSADLNIWQKAGDYDGTFNNLSYQGHSSYPLPGTTAEVTRGGTFTTSRSANNLISINEFKSDILQSVKQIFGVGGITVETGTNKKQDKTEKTKGQGKKKKEKKVKSKKVAVKKINEVIKEPDS